jgi:cold shock CspA family protein
MTGTVNNLIESKMFGFILANNGQEYFFHRSEMVEPDQWNELVSEFLRLGKNQVQVTFEPTKTDKGPRAKSVTLIPE